VYAPIESACAGGVPVTLTMGQGGAGVGGAGVGGTTQQLPHGGHAGQQSQFSHGDAQPQLLVMHLLAQSDPATHSVLAVSQTWPGAQLGYVARTALSTVVANNASSAILLKTVKF
jgi:hypothetical protein